MVRTDLVMKIQLSSNLPWHIAHHILQYCIDNNIEEEKVHAYLSLMMNKSFWLAETIALDIPDEHVTWMLLKL